MPHSQTLRMFSVPVEMLKILTAIVFLESGEFIVNDHNKILFKMYQILHKISVNKYLGGDENRLYTHCYQRDYSNIRCYFARKRRDEEEKKAVSDARRNRRGLKKKEKELSYRLGALGSSIFTFAESLDTPVVKMSSWFRISSRSWLPLFMRVESMITILNKYDYYYLMYQYNLRKPFYIIRDSVYYGIRSYHDNFLSEYDITWRGISTLPFKTEGYLGRSLESLVFQYANTPNTICYFPTDVEFLIFEYSTPSM